MNNDQPNGKAVDGQDQEVSKQRRQLLQASAVTASLIGTLRSGAALANISAYQCLETEDANQPTDVQLSETQRNTNQSGWLEITGEKITYTAVYTGGSGDPPSCPDKPVGFIFNGTQYIPDANEEYLAAVGDPRPGDCPSGITGGWHLDSWTSSTEPWYAYIYFEHLPDYTDISSGPSLLDQPSGSNNWMALTGSCWSSLGGTG